MSLRKPSGICFLDTGGFAFEEAVERMPQLPMAKKH